MITRLLHWGIIVLSVSLSFSLSAQTEENTLSAGEPTASTLETAPLPARIWLVYQGGARFAGFERLNTYLLKANLDPLPMRALYSHSIELLWQKDVYSAGLRWDNSSYCTDAVSGKLGKEMHTHSGMVQIGYQPVASIIDGIVGADMVQLEVYGGTGFSRFRYETYVQPNPTNEMSLDDYLANIAPIRRSFQYRAWLAGGGLSINCTPEVMNTWGGIKVLVGVYAEYFGPVSMGKWYSGSTQFTNQFKFNPTRSQVGFRVGVNLADIKG